MRLVYLHSGRNAKQLTREFGLRAIQVWSELRDQLAYEYQSSSELTEPVDDDAVEKLAYFFGIQVIWLPGDSYESTDCC